MANDNDPQTVSDLSTLPQDIRDQIPDDLPEVAQRALAEALLRKASDPEMTLPTELGGRDGPEPVRYGDWEKKGLAVDF